MMTGLLHRLAELKKKVEQPENRIDSWMNSSAWRSRDNLVNAPSLGDIFLLY